MDYAICPNCGRNAIVASRATEGDGETAKETLILRQHRPARRPVTDQVNTKTCSREVLRVILCDGVGFSPKPPKAK